ncbi:MAG: type IV pilus assembly protein PilM [Acidimicrobiia bacterium]|nr:type IV pilus assembly protein PilM [Acidimicrobiia bacterium]
MARRLIGLDVGTHAVTVAEVTPGDPPTLRAFGQVALPEGAMRDGEVVDADAVTQALRRLREEVGLRKPSVRVGVASPRVIVRQVEMPVMTRSELSGALEFQAADLIPIPLDEAVLDFAILDSHDGGDVGDGDDSREGGDGDESVMRVLLAAAQRTTIDRLTGAVAAAGYSVESVDLVPLALIRALARPVADNGPGAEGIVSFGGGVTCVAVHEGGMPRFVRVLGTGGRRLTEAISGSLDIAPDAAEALKRRLDDTGDDAVAAARSAVDRPVAALLDEVRSSLDYYRNQADAVRLLRVVTTGGGARLAGIDDRLAALVGVPVIPASPRSQLAIGDIGFDDDDVTRLDPYLPAPVGLALGGIAAGPVLDLAPRKRKAATSNRRYVAGGVVAALLLGALLAYPTMQRQQQIDDERDVLAQRLQENQEVQAEIASLSDAQAKQGQLESITAQLTTLLASDVSWSRLLQEMAKEIPNDVWLTSLQASVTPPLAVASPAPTTATTAPAGSPTTATTVPAAPPVAAVGVIGGAVQIQGTALDYPSVAQWLNRIARLQSLSGIWVPSAAKHALTTRDVVDFRSTAELTPSARSDRLEAFLEGER